jgi:hypothetical protein
LIPSRIAKIGFFGLQIFTKSQQNQPEITIPSCELRQLPVRKNSPLFSMTPKFFRLLHAARMQHGIHWKTLVVRTPRDMGATWFFPNASDMPIIVRCISFWGAFVSNCLPSAKSGDFSSKLELATCSNGLSKPLPAATISQRCRRAW